ncbi:MAG: hypothetical protein HOV94_12045 [Saccharothrix sp.]|nr:hypothetical protein [Saccharothrix sp.]
MDFALPVHPPSTLVAHPGCAGCLDARVWALAVDRADPTPALDGDLGLGRLFRHFRWGPSAWPVAWCDLPRAGVVDCGVFADVSAVVLAARGVECTRLQLVEAAEPAQTALWRARWARAACPDAWILSDRAVYHEALVVRTDAGELLFDPTELRPVGANGRAPLWSRRWPGEWTEG